MAKTHIWARSVPIDKLLSQRAAPDRPMASLVRLAVVRYRDRTGFARYGPVRAEVMRKTGFPAAEVDRQIGELHDTMGLRFASKPSRDRIRLAWQGERYNLIAVAQTSAERETASIQHSLRLYDEMQRERAGRHTREWQESGHVPPVTLPERPK